MRLRSALRDGARASGARRSSAASPRPDPRDVRSPAPYASITPARCLSLARAPRICSTSTPASTVGRCIGTRMRGSFAPSPGRARVTPYKNRRALTYVEGIGAHPPRQVQQETPAPPPRPSGLATGRSRPSGSPLPCEADSRRRPRRRPRRRHPCDRDALRREATAQRLRPTLRFGTPFLAERPLYDPLLAPRDARRMNLWATMGECRATDVP